MSSDPVLTLLGRYQAELEAFEPPLDCLRVAQHTWVSTRDKIIRSRPAATTAIGALAALQHVVQCKDLFDESADLQMLWHLVVAARDYFVAQSLAIAVTHMAPSFQRGPTNVVISMLPRERS